MKDLLGQKKDKSCKENGDKFCFLHIKDNCMLIYTFVATFAGQDLSGTGHIFSDKQRKRRGKEQQICLLPWTSKTRQVQ